MKKLIVLSAAPGSGKSTWAAKYKASHPDTFIISSDEIRYELTGQYQDFSKQKEVWETFDKRIVEYSHLPMKDYTVILDALTDLDEIRLKYLELGKDYDRKTLVVIRKPLEDNIKFNKERPNEKWVPDDVVVSLYNKFIPPSEEVIAKFDEYLLIKYYFY